MTSPLPGFTAMTAAARILPENKNFNPQYDSWQEQAWSMWEQVSEFEAAVSWRANAMSRIRLVAAEVVPGGDEPVMLTEGPAAEAMRRFAGGTAGQGEFMKEATIHLSVPGEGWAVGEEIRGIERWSVYSADELKFRNGRYQVKEGERANDFRPLSENAIKLRFWNRHPRHGWEADSEARHALNALTELDLINKRIVAEVMSRLASNGLLLYDKGVLSFPQLEQPEGADQADPFAAMFVAVASRGIKNPQSPEALLPIPLGYDLGDADRSQIDPKLLMQHVKFTDVIDDKLLNERESAIRRLAISMDMPPEVLTGMGELTHWNAWHVNEQGVKLHIAPPAETITNAVTVGYLEPMLTAAGAPLVGPKGGRIVAWYDPSELTTPPDRSEDVIAAYSLGEVPGRVLRREIGLNDAQDAPTDAEYVDWLTKFLGRQPETAAGVLENLTGKQIESTSEREGRPPDQEEEGGESNTEPEQRDEPELRAAKAEDVENLSDEELNNLISLVASAAKTREPAGSGTAWYEHTIPIEQRVTPKTRNGKDDA